jgi:hypothetical protein
MMTPKEKAEQLIYKMTYNGYEEHQYCTNYVANNSALIAADEILFALKYDMNEPTSGSIKYWVEVKKQLENK